MAAVTIISMTIAIAIEPLWYKMTYLVVMAPVTILGWLYKVSQKAKSAKRKLIEFSIENPIRLLRDEH